MDAESMIEQGIDMPVDIMLELDNINHSMDVLMARRQPLEILEFALYEIERVNEFREETLTRLNVLAQLLGDEEDRQDCVKQSKHCYITLCRLYTGMINTHMAHIGQYAPRAENAAIVPERMQTLLHLLSRLNEYPEDDLTREQLAEKEAICFQIIRLNEQLYREVQGEVMRCVREGRPLPCTPHEPHVIVAMAETTHQCTENILSSIVPQRLAHMPRE